ncbi:MAG: YhbY family RNA-binding protein [Candidatus Nanoarchaeia archaeon]
MVLSVEKKKELKAQSKSLKSFISVGKNGISEDTILSIQKYLKAHRLGKCAFLRSYLDEQQRDKQEVAQELADRANAQLIDRVGFTVTLYR